MTNISSDRVPAVRVRAITKATYEDVLEALYADIGHQPVPFVEITEASADWETFQAAIREWLGPSGFVLFGKVDHGQWITKAGLKTRSVRLILGNPLIAITMLQHDAAAGLFAPVELLVVEESTGETSITWMRPSTLMHAPSMELHQAASALDEKIEALIMTVLRAA